MEQDTMKTTTSMSVVVTRSEGNELTRGTVEVVPYGAQWMVLLEEGEVWRGEGLRRGIPEQSGARGPVFDEARYAAEAAFIVGERRCVDELAARRRAQGGDEEPEGAA